MLYRLQLLIYNYKIIMYLENIQYWKSTQYIQKPLLKFAHNVGIT
jgi:hypothetical protein